MRKSKTTILIAFALANALASMAQVSFEGTGGHDVFQEKPSSNTGLNYIYVLYDANGVSMNYTASNSSAEVKWYKYGSQGGAYMEELPGVVKTGNVTTLRQVVPNVGYIIEEGANRMYVWVVNYADYRLQMQTAECENNNDCGTATLHIEGAGGDIVYYSINGVAKKLDRQMNLSYYNLVWDQDKMTWNQVEQEDKIAEFKSTISLQAPYCNTSFTLSGDRFLEYWKEGVTVSTGTYLTNAVAVQTEAVQEKSDATNQKGHADGETNLGGSAPATITFTAYCTDAIAQKEWQMSHDPEFNEIEQRISEEETVQTFEEAGTTYWRFVGTNASGECDAVSDTYTINIGESSLQCPNAFSPGVTEGVNDEWKVSYNSIVKFKCWIFNSWGVQMCELTDPSQGWDGKYKGKLVKPGVYYYVIDAEGSEGKKYKLKGDINIVGLRGDRSSGGGISGE